MDSIFQIPEGGLSLKAYAQFVFQRESFTHIEIHPSRLEKVAQSRKHLARHLADGLSIYGVTTGFGSDSARLVPESQWETLQANLVKYLLCGTGPALPREAVRATLLARLNSLSMGLSGVSEDLLDRMGLFLAKDWLPTIPSKGSLGASGDLIPLAYLAYALQGEGEIVLATGEKTPTRSVLEREGERPYTLKTKEGLSMVNGTSAMLGLGLVNWNWLSYLTDLSCLMTSWACLVLDGRTDPFAKLVNEVAKKTTGQSTAARKIRDYLAEENYTPVTTKDLGVNGGHLKRPIQDRYSLRCSPQVLGPVFDLLATCESWLESELNSVSDNPLVHPEGELAMGGNFYGGYLGQSMDLMKIGIGNLGDLLDRQLMLLMDPTTRGTLSPNLISQNLGEESALHHGLKGLHQAVGALASELMPLCAPGTLSSRSAECQNQDKVSLGMSAATQCYRALETLTEIASYSLVCLAQAIDLKQISLQGKTSRELYQAIRRQVSFVEKDQPLGAQVQKVTELLQQNAKASGTL